MTIPRINQLCNIEDFSLPEDPHSLISGVALDEVSQEIIVTWGLDKSVKTVTKCHLEIPNYKLYKYVMIGKWKREGGLFNSEVPL